MVGQHYSSSRSSYGRLVSNTRDDCLQRQIAQKIVKLKFEACPLHGFQTSNGICYQFGCKLWLLSIHNYNWQPFFPSFWAPPYEVAVLFNSNLSWIPSQVGNLNLLLCTGFNLEYAALLLCCIFTQRPMNDWKIEWHDGCCLFLQQLLVISHEKKRVIWYSIISTKH